MGESANNKLAQSTLLDTLKATIPPGEWPKEGSVAEVKLLRRTDRKVFLIWGNSALASCGERNS